MAEFDHAPPPRGTWVQARARAPLATHPCPAHVAASSVGLSRAQQGSQPSPGRGRGLVIHEPTFHQALPPRRGHANTRMHACAVLPPTPTTRAVCMWGASSVHAHACNLRGGEAWSSVPAVFDQALPQRESNALHAHARATQPPLPPVRCGVHVVASSKERRAPTNSRGRGLVIECAQMTRPSPPGGSMQPRTCAHAPSPTRPHAVQVWCGAWQAQR